jgi:hypothetical protein
MITKYFEFKDSLRQFWYIEYRQLTKEESTPYGCHIILVKNERGDDFIDRSIKNNDEFDDLELMPHNIMAEIAREIAEVALNFASGGNCIRENESPPNITRLHSQCTSMFEGD